MVNGQRYHFAPKFLLATGPRHAARPAPNSPARSLPETTFGHLARAARRCQEPWLSCRMLRARVASSAWCSYEGSP